MGDVVGIIGTRAVDNPTSKEDIIRVTKNNGLSKKHRYNKDFVLSLSAVH